MNIFNKICSNWEDKYPGHTKGIGKLKGVQVKLHIDESVRPVAITNRNIPFHMRRKIEEEELRLLKEDTIEKVPVGEPTPWVSPVVTLQRRTVPYDCASTCVSLTRRSHENAITCQH